MKRCLMTICFGVIAVSPVLAQENKNVAPVPGSADNGPSLDVTMKFIQEKLKAKLSEWEDVTADPTSCQITFAKNLKPKGYYNTIHADATATTFSFREVEKIEVQVRRDDDGDAMPGIYDLMVSMTTEKSVHESDYKKGKICNRRDFGFWRSFGGRGLDEDLANRVAKAMVHAVELCGGGSKAEPF